MQTTRKMELEKSSLAQHQMIILWKRGFMSGKPKMLQTSQTEMVQIMKTHLMYSYSTWQNF